MRSLFYIDAKNIIFAGFYGTGKTEFCLNYALNLRESVKENINICDFDIINPYFRSREKLGMLKDYNIYILGNSLNNNIGQDLPAVSFNCIEPMLRGEYVIFDLAGSKNGFKALSFILDILFEKGYKLYLVVNAYRKESSSSEKIIDFIRSIEENTLFKFSGIVNNSHLLHFTDGDHVLHGQDIALDVSHKMDIPIEYTLLREDIYEKIRSKLKSNDVLTFKKLIMREDWQ